MLPGLTSKIQECVMIYFRQNRANLHYKKLKEYHDKMCEGKSFRECNNCNFHDEVDTKYSSCRVFCDDCEKKSGLEKYKQCDNCKYCEDCTECTIYKCDNDCVMQCYVCHFKDNMLYNDIWINNCKCCKYYVTCDCASNKCESPWSNDDAVRIRIYLLSNEINDWKIIFKNTIYLY